MESQFLKSYRNVLDWCYKDHSSIYILQRKQAQTLQVEILEINLYCHTIKQLYDPPLFEGVLVEDFNYHLLYNQSNQLILIYPTNIIVIYDTQNIELVNVVQASNQFNISCPILVKIQDEQNSQQSKDILVFMSMIQTQQAQEDRFVLAPLEYIEDLSKKAPKRIIQVRAPFKGIQVTDIVEIKHSQYEYLVSFSNGKIWHVQVYDPRTHQRFLNIDQQKISPGEAKGSQVNAIDYIFLNNEKVFYIGIGDRLGKLTIFKMRDNNQQKIIFLEQISFNQIISLKWISLKMTMAIITSDGVLQLQQLEFVQGNNVKLKKLCQVSMFEEIPLQLNLSNGKIRMNQSIQVILDQSEQYPQTIGVQWPESILFKINRKTNEKTLLLDRKLSVFKIYDSYQPIYNSQRVPIISQSSPQQFESLVPKQKDDQIHTNAFTFFIEQSENKIYISLFQEFDGLKRKLININEQSGNLTTQTQASMLDVRPRQFIGQSQYRFLVQTRNDNQENLCYCFHYDMINDKLIGNIQQFFGVQSLFIGNQESEQPAILILQEDLKTLTVFAYDKQLQQKLPHGNVTLLNKAKSIFWTPFRNGLCVLYESYSDNIIRFSKNRLQANQEADLKILAQNKYSFKLSYDEKVFEVQWTNYISQDEQQIRGAISSNQRICIVDQNLGILINVNQSSDNFITSMMWFGYTLLYTTERHLLYLTKDKSEIGRGTICGFNSSQKAKPRIIVNAASDRIITAYISEQTFQIEVRQNTLNQTQLQFLVKQVLMLECLLVGYLSYMKNESLNLQMIRHCLQFLDTSQISPNLLKKLQKLNLCNSALYLVRNTNCCQFDISDKAVILNQLGQQEKIFDYLFMNKDITKETDKNEVIQKLQNETEYQLERKILQEYLEIFINKNMVKSAIKCCELLNQSQKALEILKKFGDQEGLLGFQKLFEQGKIKQDMVTIEFFQKMNMQTNLDSKKLHQVVKDKFQGWGLNEKEFQDFQREDNQNVLDKEISSLNRINLAYDEAPFSLVTQTYHSQCQSVHSVINENIANWIGYDSLVSDYIPQNNFYFNFRERKVIQFLSKEQENQEQINDEFGQILDEEVNADDIEEKGLLLFYWRLDEGKGTNISDITDNEIHTQLKIDQQWSQEVLQNGVPMEYEDKWGKQNLPNYSISIPNNDQYSLKAKFSQSIINKLKLSNNFCIEFWILPPQDLCLTLLKTRNIQLDITQNSLRIKNKQQDNEIKFNQMLQQNNWNHIAISNNAYLKKIEIYQNSNIIVSAINKQYLPQFQHEQEIELFINQSNEPILLTEIRLWASNMTQKIIQENYKQPLSMLYEQKRAIKIKINKKEQTNNGKKQGLKKLGGGGLNKLGGGGLKMRSALDRQQASKVSSPSKNSEQYSQQREIEEDKQEQSFQPKFESHIQNQKQFDQNNRQSSLGFDFSAQQEENQNNNFFGF